jgi:ferrous iron transport protein A
MLTTTPNPANASDDPLTAVTAAEVGARSLLDLKRHQAARVREVLRKPGAAFDLVARRLDELGFVPGEPVKVVAFGPLGADPVLVQIGFTRFALRRAEAARVLVQ